MTLKHVYPYWVRQGKSGLFNICPNVGIKCDGFWQYPRWAIVNNTPATYEGNEDTTYFCWDCKEEE